MNDEILKKLEARLDRRGFLVGPGLGMAALLGLAAASPLVAFAQAQDKPQTTDDTKKKTDSEKKDQDGQKADERQDPPKASSVEGSTTETKLDANGVEFRECPQCGHNMYQQGRTWTCENCGYSYIE